MKKPNQNARRHGFYSTEVLLPDESEEEYAALQQRLRQEWLPEGPIEESAVDDMAVCVWQKFRLRAWLRNAFETSDFTALSSDVKKCHAHFVQQHERLLASFESLLLGATDRADQAVEALSPKTDTPAPKTSQTISENLEQKSEAENVLAGIARLREQDERQARTAKQEALAGELIKAMVILSTLISSLEGNLLSQYEALRKPLTENVSNILDIEGMLDKWLQKAMTRLVTAKEMKRIYRPLDVVSEITTPTTLKEPLARGSLRKVG